jgi:hypothetical protein
MATTRRTPSKRLRQTSVDIEEVERVAEEVTGIVFARKTETEKDKSFKQHFGCRPVVVATAWKLMQEHTNHDAPDAFSLKHLLWALIFLKTYGVEAIRTTLASAGTGTRPDDKTVRDWCWVALNCLANLAPYVVRSFFVVLLFRCYQSTSRLIVISFVPRSYGKTDYKMTLFVIVWCLLMERISL